MKNVKISQSAHQKLKQLAGREKLTMSEVVEKLLSSYFGVPHNKVEDGGNASQNKDTTGHRIPVEKTQNASALVEKEKYVTREEFDEFAKSIEVWSRRLLEGLSRAGVKLP